MDFKNNYYILRHGKTTYQKDKKDLTYPRNPTDSVPLADEGREQIRKRSQEIKELGISKIYASDFLRTKQTAQIVKNETGFSGEIIFDRRLRDLDLGVWHDRKKEDFYNKFPINKNSFSIKLEGGESWEMVEKRMIGVLEDIDKNNSQEKVLIISHGDPLWLLEGRIKNKSKEELIKEKKSKKGFIKPAELRKII